MNCYAIRLNEMGNYKEMIETCFERIDKVIGVYHTGKDFNNPHYHFIAFTEMKQPAMRAHMKLFYNLGKGNKHLSIKRCDGNEKTWSYLFHEHKRESFEVVIRKMYKDEDINKYIEMNDKIIEKMKETSANASIAAIYNEMIEDGHKKEPTMEIVFKYIMFFYMKKEWLPNKYQCERYIMKIQCMFLKNQEDQERWINNKFNEWFCK